MIFCRSASCLSRLTTASEAHGFPAAMTYFCAKMTKTYNQLVFSTKCPCSHKHTFTHLWCKQSSFCFLRIFYARRNSGDDRALAGRDARPPAAWKRKISLWASARIRARRGERSACQAARTETAPRRHRRPPRREGTADGGKEKS